MAKLQKDELIRQVNMGAREYGIRTVLFRHTVAEILGVNVTDMECLALVFFKGLATPSELARYTGLTSGATTAMLDRLEKAHLIERHPHPRDRRGTLIVLTTERNGEIGGMFAPVRAEVERLNSSYSAHELEIVSGYFEKLATLWTEGREKLQQRLKAK